MKRRTCPQIIVPCLVLGLTAAVGRVSSQTSITSPETAAGLDQTGDAAPEESTQAAELSARIDEVVALLKTPPMDSKGSVRAYDASAEATLQETLRAEDQQAAELQAEGRLREALTLREQMVRMALASPPGKIPPITVYKFQYMEKLQDLYVQCSFVPEASQFKASLDNLNALRPKPPSPARVEAAQTPRERKPAPPSNLHIITAQ